MTDSRRDFLLRFAATALAAGTAGCQSAPEHSELFGDKITPHVVYGVPPNPLGDFVSSVGDKVYFDTDRSLLRADSKAILDRQAEWARRNPAFTFTVEGHADERGTREYNLALAEKRAQTVKMYLAARGVDHKRITVVSYGKERPAALGSNEAAWAQNRRAVTIPHP
ncbi:peptidoglycan-associated lipoprotein Pal [Magnetospirillum moscoviense]|uniref:Peptidoglycan-associated lipoprotein n=1 Tax=Magnetospirillum moscoviense TaxID=1437059 RepID=A0A178MRM1_9PROT|nr:peptidoglycan-associated lipoprotein Pal [Magnetospirillum moscoviense]MBF0324490.1 peptidoglycan-associated lipoprotein Pal [Alphaproteobacteria bacterium]OAN51516.1 hypothetical protein A6A05_01245 [Magnetospirillum moscoviense]